jgi:hypothetical protein
MSPKRLLVPFVSASPVRSPIEAAMLAISTPGHCDATQERPQPDLNLQQGQGSENQKTCRGRRCGNLSDKNRTAPGRRSAAVQPTPLAIVSWRTAAMQEY